MDIGALLAALINSPSFIAIYLCLIFSTASFAIGSLRAAQNGSFLLSLFSSWVKTDGPQIGIIFTWLLLGTAVSLVDTSKIPLLPADFVSAGIIGYGLIQAATFILAKFESIRSSVNPVAAAKRVADAEEAATRASDPLPTA